MARTYLDFERPIAEQPMSRGILRGRIIQPILKR